MGNVAKSDLGLSTDEIAGVIGRVHGLRADQIQAIRARLKQLQRLFFLPSQHVGRGAEVRASALDLVMFALAFEIMDAGLSTASAAQILKGSNASCRAALVEAAGDQEASDPWVVGISAQTLTQVRNSYGEGASVAAASLAVIRQSELIALSNHEGARVLTVIFLAKMVADVRRAARAGGFGDWFESQFKSLSPKA